MAGGAPRPLPALGPGDQAFAWTGDGKGLYFVTSKPEDAWPRKICALDLATGSKRFWKGIAPSDPTGVGGVGPIPAIAADGKSYVYSYSRQQSELELLDGLKSALASSPAWRDAAMGEVYRARDFRSFRLPSQSINATTPTNRTMTDTINV